MDMVICFLAAWAWGYEVDNVYTRIIMGIIAVITLLSLIPAIKLNVPAEYLNALYKLASFSILLMLFRRKSREKKESIQNKHSYNMNLRG